MTVQVRQGGFTPVTKAEKAAAYAVADAMLARDEWELEITFVTGLSLWQVRSRRAKLLRTKAIDAAQAQGELPDIDAFTRVSRSAVRPPIEDSREEALALVAAGHEHKGIARALGVPLYQLRAWVAQANTQP